MPAIGKGVSLVGIRQDMFNYTFNISGTAGVNPGVGTPLALDTTADNTVKVAGDGDTIIGFLMSYENRVQEGIAVCVVSLKGTQVCDYTGTAPTRGVGVVGSATAKKVKAAAGPVVGCIVVAVDTTALQVVVVYG